MLNFQSLNRNLNKVKPAFQNVANAEIRSSTPKNQRVINLLAQEGIRNQYLNTENEPILEGVKRELNTSCSSNEEAIFQLSKPFAEYKANPDPLTLNLQKFQKLGKAVTGMRRNFGDMTQFLDDKYVRLLGGINEQDHKDAWHQPSISYDSRFWFFWDPLLLIAYLYCYYNEAMIISFEGSENDNISFAYVGVSLLNFIDVLFNCARAPDQSSEMEIFRNAFINYISFWCWLDLLTVIRPQILFRWLFPIEIIRMKTVFRGIMTINRGVGYVIHLLQSSFFCISSLAVLLILQEKYLGR